MENLDSDFSVLEIDRNVGERKTHLCMHIFMCFGRVSFKNFQDNHPSVC